MCDKFFENVGLSDDVLFAGGGSVNLIHQLGELVEGGFLAHFMLSHYFRKYSSGDNSSKALLILNHHSKAHWANIGSKLGTNISALEEKGSLVVIDLIKESYQTTLQLDQLENNSSTSSSPMCLKTLYSRCEKIMQDFKKSDTERLLIIVEDLTDFVDSNTSSIFDSEKEVLQFFMKLKAFNENTFNITLVSLIQSPQAAADSLELTRFAKAVTNALPTVIFEVSPLSTGYSAQVTGFLRVFCNPRKVSYEKRIESASIRTYHFKLDSNTAHATAL